MRLKDNIGKSTRMVLLAAAIVVGLSGPVAAMDRTTMLTMFWGGNSTPAPSGEYWQRVDDTDILRVDGTQIEVFA